MFNLYSYRGVNQTVIEHKIVKSGVTVEVGEILALDTDTSGHLVAGAATSAGKQLYVAMGPVVGDGIEEIPVERIRKDALYQVLSSGVIAKTAVGNVYTLDSDGTGITTTKTAGVFNVEYTDGASPSRCIGYFANADTL